MNNFKKGFLTALGAIAAILIVVFVINFIDNARAETSYNYRKNHSTYSHSIFVTNKYK